MTLWAPSYPLYEGLPRRPGQRRRPRPAYQNEENTKTLGRVLNRPTVFSLLAPTARIALGQPADELLLASQRVEPAKLKESVTHSATPSSRELFGTYLGGKRWRKSTIPLSETLA
jgi:hypothetical protein